MTANANTFLDVVLANDTLHAKYFKRYRLRVQEKQMPGKLIDHMLFCLNGRTNSHNPRWATSVRKDNLVSKLSKKQGELGVYIERQNKQKR
jgi:hypothetical protein